MFYLPMYIDVKYFSWFASLTKLKKINKCFKLIYAVEIKKATNIILSSAKLALKFNTFIKTIKIL